MKKMYAVVDNNHDNVGEYEEWVDGIYSTPERAVAGALKCEKKLIKELQENYDCSLAEAQRTCNNLLEDTPIEIRVYALDRPDGLEEIMVEHQDNDNI